MHRQKGTKNAPQAVIDEIVRRHQEGASVSELAQIYNKPFKTIKNMVYREGKKQREAKKGKLPGKRNSGREPAVTLQEHKYEFMINQITVTYIMIERIAMYRAWTPEN